MDVNVRNFERTLFRIYLYKVMCICPDVDSSRDPRKRSFEINPEPYNAVGNDEKITLILTFF